MDMPDGRTVAVEVKTYGEYRTITLKDGTKETVKNEVPLSKGIKEQIHKDIALREMNPGYDPRGSFTHAGPSEGTQGLSRRGEDRVPRVWAGIKEGPVGRSTEEVD
ncbi:hypothetical protein [Streptomyces sp. NPDC005407]|uniref:hypothetical protein n=1 Tax=Streptomyces sp. NPDC005407 TaxID=3155340 RepID=UPI0033A788D3